MAAENAGILSKFSFFFVPPSASIRLERAFSGNPHERTHTNRAKSTMPLHGIVPPVLHFRSAAAF
jgi:hypothetical protein